MRQTQKARSVVWQTVHYLARPHLRVPTGPIPGPAAWHSADHADESTWTHALSQSEIRDLETALKRANRRQIATEKLRAPDFPLGQLARHLPRWRRILGHGRGFVRIRGVPVKNWERADVERFFWALGQHLGIPGAQNSDGHLLGHVRDQRLGRDGQIRQYRTREAIRYHCDTADVVGLLCVHGAARGGTSRIASSVAVFNRVLKLRPDLAPSLFAPIWVDTRGDGGVDAFRVDPGAFDGAALRTFFHSEYMRTAQRYPDIPRLTHAQDELLGLYDQLAESPEFRLDMDFRPGDIQLISNHTILHARTDYQDAPEPAPRRHLLRLWLSLDRSYSLREQALRARAAAGILVGLARRKWLRANNSKTA